MARKGNPMKVRMEIKGLIVDPSTNLPIVILKGAEDAIALVDKAIDDVNVVRAGLGAIQKNALEANIRSLAIRP